MSMFGLGNNCNQGDGVHGHHHHHHGHHDAAAQGSECGRSERGQNDKFEQVLQKLLQEITQGQQC